MAALAKERTQKPLFIKSIRLPMGANFKAWKGGMACIDTAAAGVVVQGKTSTTLTRIGQFAETVDNTGGAASAQLVNVDLDREICCMGFVNDGTITSANLLTNVYVADDHTVTATATGASHSGYVWKLEGTALVFVGPLP
ncbi:MAG TPA: hypothetical protein VGH28_10510 [Polyangiaceae bacterium]|jgi:hypothetical protein